MRFPPLILITVMSVALTASEAQFPDVSHADLIAAIEEDRVVLLDANGTDMYQSAHIPGAYDFAALSESDSLASVLPEDKGALIIAYCGGPGCKAYVKAAEAASDLGYTNVKHYSLGIKGWRERNSDKKEDEDKDGS
jgi:rhodanese-related sulfurtransferase